MQAQCGMLSYPDMHWHVLQSVIFLEPTSHFFCSAGTSKGHSKHVTGDAQQHTISTTTVKPSNMYLVYVQVSPHLLRSVTWYTPTKVRALRIPGRTCRYCNLQILCLRLCSFLAFVFPLLRDRFSSCKPTRFRSFQILGHTCRYCNLSSLFPQLRICQLRWLKKAR